MLAFGHRLRRLAALTEVCQPASIATINSTASSVPAFRLLPFMRGFSPPPTSAIASVVRRARTHRVPVSAHTLRHTFALGYLRDNPGKLVELATLLGHESLDTTAVYTRPSNEDLAADLERSHLNVDS